MQDVGGDDSRQHQGQAGDRRLPAAGHPRGHRRYHPPGAEAHGREGHDDDEQEERGEVGGDVRPETGIDPWGREYKKYDFGRISILTK